MARRAWTAEDVLEAILEDEDFDDPNEPMLEGSDDEFSDLEMEEDSPVLLHQHYLSLGPPA